MNYEIDKLETEDWLLLAKLITLCCEMSEGEMVLDIEDDDLDNATQKLNNNVNYNQIDFMMKELGDTGVIEWDAVGEEGFKPSFRFAFNKKTFQFFKDKVLKSILDDREKLLSKINDLEGEIESIYKFNPQKLNENIEKTNKSAEHLLRTIQQDENLKSLENPIKEYRDHLDRICNINKSYQNIFTHIVRPIQEEGERGVKATAKWAIVSVVAASIISIIIGNWNTITTTMTSLTKH